MQWLLLTFIVVLCKIIVYYACNGSWILMYLHKTEDINIKKVKQLQTQYVYLAINRRATPAICGKCKAFKHIRHEGT
jgi:hypothetical protein